MFTFLKTICDLFLNAEIKLPSGHVAPNKVCQVLGDAQKDLISHLGLFISYFILLFIIFIELAVKYFNGKHN